MPAGEALGGQAGVLGTNLHTPLLPLLADAGAARPVLGLPPMDVWSRPARRPALRGERAAQRRRGQAARHLPAGPRGHPPAPDLPVSWRACCAPACLLARCLIRCAALACALGGCLLRLAGCRCAQSCTSCSCTHLPAAAWTWPRSCTRAPTQRATGWGWSTSCSSSARVGAALCACVRGMAWEMGLQQEGRAGRGWGWSTSCC